MKKTDKIPRLKELGRIYDESTSFFMSRVQVI